jgi:hypothetical protein
VALIAAALSAARKSKTGQRGIRRELMTGPGTSSCVNLRDRQEWQ